LPAHRLRWYLNQLNVGPGTTLLDIGSGDGRVVAAAAQQGATATGLEASWPLIVWSRLRGWRQRAKSTFIAGDAFDQAWPVCTVTWIYWIPWRLKDTRALARLDEVRSNGSTICSLRFPIPGWTPTLVLTPAEDGRTEAWDIFCYGPIESPVTTIIEQGSVP